MKKGSKKEEHKELIQQMKKDLNMAQKISKENPSQDIESLILSGIFVGRQMENERIIQQLELVGIKTPDNLKSIVNQLKDINDGNF